MNPTWLYVGALYSAAVALARRARIELPKRIALLFYALVLVFFFKPMTQAYVNIPVDMLSVLPPWSLLEAPHWLNPEMNDVPFQHTPWAHQVRESWKAGRAPLWNEAAGSGYPLLANGQSSALSPIRLLALPLDLGHAMTAEAAMKILIALTFTFLFCRGRRWSELASTVGAVTFAFGGFMSIWLHFPHITTACFLPAVLYLIDRLAESGIADRGSQIAGEAAASRAQPAIRDLRSAICLSVVWAALIYGGHPETVSHIFVLALLYALWIVFVERSASWKLFLVLGGALFAGTLLASPFLLPFAEAVKKSQRYELLKVSPWSAERLPYQDLRSALVQVQAHFWGRVPMESKWGPSDPDPLSGYAGVLGIAAWVALLVSTTRRRAWRSREMFFVLATLFVVAVIFGCPGISEGMHKVLPLVAHHRFRLLLTMLLAIQAACLVDRMERGEERKATLIGIGAVAVLLVVPFLIVKFPTHERFVGALLAAVPSVVVLVAAAGRALPSRRLDWVGPLLLVAVIVEVWSVTYVWSPPLPERLMYPRTPFIEALERLKAGEREPFRVAGWGSTLFPNNAAMFGLEDIRVHDPMGYAKYMSYLKLAAGYGAWDYFAHWLNVDTPLLDYLNVRYVLIDDPALVLDATRYELVYSGRDGRIFRNRHWLPRFFPVRNVVLEFRREHFWQRMKDHQDFANTAVLEKLAVESPQMRDDFLLPRPAGAPPATSRIVSAKHADYRISVHAPRCSLVVSSIPWWPGWKVERNGRRVDPIRVNGVFLGFAVPPGESDVRVWYAPWTYWVGVWVAVATGLLLVAGSWLSVVKSKKPQATSNQQPVNSPI
jgi:uncharacterized membrane protein YsdA (DUF1294 family)